jgi:hypothetical protein
MTVERDLTLTLNSTLHMWVEAEVYIFSRWRIVFIMSCKFFMNFVKIYELL